MQLALQFWPQTLTRASYSYGHLNRRPRSMSTTPCAPCSGSFLQLPGQSQVLLVNSAEQLLKASYLVVETAYVCGIDAEWEPGSATASATLLQLAFATGKELKQCHIVLLLDLLSLPQPAVKDFLQSLLRNASVLKVGYGLVHDLWAIAAALGDEGLGCVSVVEPQLDVGMLHRQLHRAHVPGIKKVVGKGLSALIEAQLAVPLDKSLQCSSWGTRPLTQAQIEYAALDAACLLMLLDSFMACAPPHLSTQTANPTAEPTTAQTHSPAAAGAVCTLRPCLDAAKASGSGDEHEDEDVDGDARADACPIASGRCSSQHPSRNGLHSDAPAVTGGSPPTAAPGDGPSPTALGVSPAAAVGGVNAQQAGRVPQQLPQEQVEQSEHQAAVKQAMEHWACRLEMSSAGKGSKPRARRHLSRRQRAHIRHAMEQQNQIDNAAGAPVHIPWQDHDGEPRFICDVMTEGLAKQLRLYGVDAAAVESKGKGSRHLVYRQMVDVAEAEQRVILTCDRTFIRMGYSDQAFYVRTTNKQEQVREVLAHFNITIKEDSLLSRCAKCNGTFFPRPISAEELPPNVSDVPQHVKDMHKEFWVCEKCGQAYWQGSQYGNAIQQLSQKLSGLAV